MGNVIVTIRVSFVTPRDLQTMKNLLKTSVNLGFYNRIKKQQKMFITLNNIGISLRFSTTTISLELMT